MKYVVAVSGGVDSVVLLDMLVREGVHEIIVAHFDHGIRPESAADARFVTALADQYGLKCVVAREELGASASEATARERRYAFLRSVAASSDARLVTAHHQDDLIETIAINLLRGTGWRGLAVLGNKEIERPLLHMTKREIYEYALTRKLEWVEDETNQSDKYLRNRVRRKIGGMSEALRSDLVALWHTQQLLAAEIDEQTSKLPLTSRYFITMIDDSVAIELLRALLLEKNLSLTRPQRSRLLHAIKTAKPGDRFEAGQGVTVQFTLREFIVN